jgi:hypothetical protein
MLGTSIPVPKAEIKMIVGASDFGYEGVSYPHFVAGTAIRIHISRHWSVEPEFNYMRRSSNDQDYIVQPNVVYEFNSLGNRVVPYLIGGVGVIRHKSVFHGSDFVTGAPVTFDTSYMTWSANAGAGLKVFLSKHLFVAPKPGLAPSQPPELRSALATCFPCRTKAFCRLTLSQPIFLE